MSTMFVASARGGRFTRAAVSFTGVAAAVATLVLTSGSVPIAGQRSETAAAPPPPAPTSFVSGSGNFSPMVADSTRRSRSTTTCWA